LATSLMLSCASWANCCTSWATASSLTAPVARSAARAGGSVSWGRGGRDKLGTALGSWALGAHGCELYGQAQRPGRVGGEIERAAENDPCVGLSAPSACVATALESLSSASHVDLASSASLPPPLALRLRARLGAALLAAGCSSAVAAASASRTASSAIFAGKSRTGAAQLGTSSCCSWVGRGIEY
jgi:hypothetical protein